MEGYDATTVTTLQFSIFQSMFVLGI